MRNNSLRSLSAVVSVLALGVIAIILFFGLDTMSEDSSEKQLELVRQAVYRAAVQCYALEGAYPPDIQYLRDNYGLDVDETRYFIDYTVEGSNLRPDIRVLPQMD